MDKRQLGVNLLLVGLLFVATAHALIALLVFDTGLEQISGLVAALALLGLAFVNL